MQALPLSCVDERSACGCTATSFFPVSLQKVFFTVVHTPDPEAYCSDHFSATHSPNKRVLTQEPPGCSNIMLIVLLVVHTCIGPQAMLWKSAPDFKKRHVYENCECTKCPSHTMYSRAWVFTISRLPAWLAEDLNSSFIAEKASSSKGRENICSIRCAKSLFSSKQSFFQSTKEARRQQWRQHNRHLAFVPLVRKRRQSFCSPDPISAWHSSPLRDSRLGPKPRLSSQLYSASVAATLVSVNIDRSVVLLYRQKQQKCSQVFQAFCPSFLSRQQSRMTSVCYI